MYKKAKRYDAMVRLVAKHRPDVLKETHQYLAQQLEMDGSLKEAEQHYAEAGEWLSAVNMCVYSRGPAMRHSVVPLVRVLNVVRFESLVTTSTVHNRDQRPLIPKRVSPAPLRAWC